MKKISLILSFIFCLSACSEESSHSTENFGDKYETSRSGNTCEPSINNICQNSVLPIAMEIKKNGRNSALEKLKKEFSLPESFDGSDESFQAYISDFSLRIEAKNRFLILADKEYRNFHNYDEDVKEATAIVRNLMLNFLKNDKNDNDLLRNALNKTSVKSVSEIFESFYRGKDVVTIDILALCGSDGLKVNARSLLPPDSPNGIIYLCPGHLLLDTGKNKNERILSLVKIMSHEMTHQLQYQGFKLDRETLSCVTGDLVDRSKQYVENKNKEIEADIVSFKIINSFFKQEKNLVRKNEKIKTAISSLCHIDDNGTQSDSSTHLDNLSRLRNYFKLKETSELLGCNQRPSC